METQTTIQTFSDSNRILSPTEKAWLSFIPEQYRDKSLENCDELPENLVGFGKSWANTFPPKSLFLYGNYGSGKTTFAFSIIREFLKNFSTKGYLWPNYYTGRQLDNALLKAVKSDSGEEWEIEKMADSNLLFIDDIDKLVPTERLRVQLFEIFNRRYTKNNPTIITSNCDPRQLTNLIDGAVLSRMGDSKKWQTIEFPDKDIRKSATLNFN